MPTITDILMVIITTVYAVITVGIMLANRKSAVIAEKQLMDSKRQLKESRKQLEESKRQFKETQKQYEEAKRLECLPFIQMEFLKGRAADSNFMLDFSSEKDTYEFKDAIQKNYFKLRNVGNGTAIDLIYTWKCEDEKAVVYFTPINAIMQGDEYIVEIIFGSLHYLPEEWTGTLTFEFKDLLYNTYTQTIRFIREDYLTINTENSTPVLQ